MLPSVDGLLAALCGAVVVGGIGVLAIIAVTGMPARPDYPAPRDSRAVAALRALQSPAVSGRIAAGVLVGVLALVLTRWPVAALGLAALVICWPQMFGGQRLEQQQITRLEALVMWTESLRDTITARASLEQAIPVTAANAPAPIRPALTRLTGLVRARVPLDRALLALSQELNDASADKVIGALILNVRQRGSGLAAVLTALARSARDELDQRRRISAGRAAMRRSVQIVVVITVGFAMFLVVFGRAYVAPYASPSGQIALAVVVGFFALGFGWMRNLAGGEAALPFLTKTPSARSAGEDVRVIAHLTGLDQHATAAPSSSPWTRSS
jgi:tight adherence protein B